MLAERGSQTFGETQNEASDSSNFGFEFDGDRSAYVQLENTNED